jgi:hypothetical protein
MAMALHPFLLFANQVQSESSKKSLCISKDIYSVDPKGSNFNLQIFLTNMIKDIRPEHLKTIQTYMFLIHDTNHYLVYIFNRHTQVDPVFKLTILNNTEGQTKHAIGFSKIFQRVLQARSETKNYKISVNHIDVKTRSQITNSCGPASVENLFVYMVNYEYTSSDHYINDFIKFIRQDNELCTIGKSKESDQSKSRKLLYITSFLKTIEHNEEQFTCVMPLDLLQAKIEISLSSSSSSSKKRTLSETEQQNQKIIFDDLS